jgi:hypothetical protein
VLLTGTDPEEAGYAMTEGDLDGLLAMRSRRAWLDPESPLMQGFILD